MKAQGSTEAIDEGKYRVQIKLRKFLIPRW